MTFYAVSALVNTLTSLLLGILLATKKRSKINIAFFIFCLTVTFWSFSYFFWQLSENESSALFWVRLLTLGSILIPVFYYRFTLIFLGIEKGKEKFILILGYLFAAFLISIIPTNLLIDGVSRKLNFEFWPNAGPMYILLILMFCSFAVYSIILFFKKYLVENDTKKKQLKILIIGTGFPFICGATNFLLWYDIPIRPYGNIFVSLFVISVAYAVVKHHLMNIRFVLRRYSVNIISIVSLLLVSYLVRFVLLCTIKNSIYLEMIIIALTVSLYPYIKDYFNKIANKYFFTSLYDSRALISKLSDQMRSTLEIDKIYGFIFDALMKSLHIRAAGVLIYNKTRREYMVQFKRSGEVKDFLMFKSRNRYKYQGVKVGHFLSNKYIDVNKPVIVEDLRGLEKDHKGIKATIKMLDDIKVEVLIPLNLKDKKIGLLALGDKESRDLFNEEDLYVLNVIGTQTAIALENALLYSETKNFNVKLEKEVWNATKELIEANEKLTKLDQAKSEFISIASHQLRTPLTVIKGYISMILEGSFGDMAVQQRASLSKVYESNERLIQLVEDLLNISRIESGRLVFNFEEKSLCKMVESVHEELSGPARKKGLDFTVKKPVKLPKIKMDEDKLRQVVMNLTDNAIKYTMNGNVTITLKKVVKDKLPTSSVLGNDPKDEKQTYVQFCVSDSGMGIKPEDKVNLFKKFSRGTGTSLIHTEGTGLGLYVAKQMVESHNGYTWAESKGEGKGSKFCFEIPAV